MITNPIFWSDDIIQIFLGVQKSRHCTKMMNSTSLLVDNEVFRTVSQNPKDDTLHRATGDTDVYHLLGIRCDTRLLSISLRY